MTEWPVHARITGPIVMIGFGSIGKGTLPLIERHFDYDPARFVVIDPSGEIRSISLGYTVGPAKPSDTFSGKDYGHFSTQ